MIVLYLSLAVSLGRKRQIALLKIRLQHAAGRAGRPDVLAVEPFDVYCETCRARLRVREEQFVGEIHPCPKCNSMVLIAAPADATLAAGSATEPVGPATTIGGGGLAARLAGLVGRHAIALSVGSAVLVVGGSLAVSIIGGEADDVVARTGDTVAGAADARDAVEAAIDPANENEPTTLAATEADDETKYDDPISATPEPSVPAITTTLPPLPALSAGDGESSKLAELAAADQRPATEVDSPPADDDETKSERTLRLDPLRFDPQRASLGNVTGRPSNDAAREYASDGEDGDGLLGGAKPRAAEAGDPIDVAAQMGIEITSIDLPATTLADFVEMVSGMAAVPMKFDPAVGVSVQTEITVRGRDVTLGKLLDDILADQGLARIERNGAIVIVKQSDR